MILDRHRFSHRLRLPLCRCPTPRWMAYVSLSRLSSCPTKAFGCHPYAPLQYIQIEAAFYEVCSLQADNAFVEHIRGWTSSAPHTMDVGAEA